MDGEGYTKIMREAKMDLCTDENGHCVEQDETEDQMKPGTVLPPDKRGTPPGCCDHPDGHSNNRRPSHWAETGKPRARPPPSDDAGVRNFIYQHDAGVL